MNAEFKNRLRISATYAYMSIPSEIEVADLMKSGSYEWASRILGEMTEIPKSLRKYIGDQQKGSFPNALDFMFDCGLIEADERDLLKALADDYCLGHSHSDEPVRFDVQDGYARLGCQSAMVSITVPLKTKDSCGLLVAGVEFLNGIVVTGQPLEDEHGRS